MTKTKRKTYTPEFKAKAASLVEAGQSVAAVAKALKVTPKSVASWTKPTPKKATPKTPSPTDKITRLEKALAKSQADLAAADIKYKGVAVDYACLLSDIGYLKAAIRVLSN